MLRTTFVWSWLTIKGLLVMIQYCQMSKRRKEAGFTWQSTTISLAKARDWFVYQYVQTRTAWGETLGVRVMIWAKFCTVLRLITCLIKTLSLYLEVGIWTKQRRTKWSWLFDLLIALEMNYVFLVDLFSLEQIHLSTQTTQFWHLVHSRWPDKTCKLFIWAQKEQGAYLPCILYLIYCALFANINLAQPSMKSLHHYHSSFDGIFK